MRVQNLIEVVRSIDEWHSSHRQGNTRLRSAAEGVTSMIPGALAQLSDEDLCDTLLGTFGINLALIKRPEDLFVDERDIARCRQLWTVNMFGG